MRKFSARLLSFFFTGFVFFCGLSVAHSNAQTACVAGTWVTPNLNGTGVVGDWPIAASSTHFDLHYDPAIANPDQTQAQNGLAMMENIWSQFMGAPFNWPEPFCNSTVKDKGQIFVSDLFFANSGGFNNNDMGMYWGPQLLTSPYVAGYEFTHALQFNSNGMFGTNYGGWFWESHSALMTLNLNQNHDLFGCAYILAAEPHLYFGSTRDNFCTFLFWEYEKDQYGFTPINNIWANAPRPNTVNAPNADPLFIYANNQGWSISQLNDEFGRWAMANVNWDYVNIDDGNNDGPALRAYIGANTANSGVNDPYVPNWTRTRLTQLNQINQSQRVYQVPSYWAPQRYGYNLIRLVPDAGASSVTVNFTGLVQNALTNFSFSGQDNTPATVPLPNSDWRWGLVAIDVNGNSRKSALQSGASASLTFNVQPDDQGLYMTVVGTPLQQQSILNGQIYYSIYRYPYQVQLENAQPDGYQAGFQRLNPPGSIWPNGGGFVATGVTPDPTVYIGPNAAVLGGTVTQNAVITDNATVWNGTVSGNAVIGGLTQWNDNLNATGNAVIKVVKDVQGLLSPPGTTFGGTVQIGGAIEEYFSPAPTSGVYYDYLINSFANNPADGGSFTTPPVEVTAPIQIGSTAQTITFPAIPAQTAGSYYALSATAGSGLPIGYFSQTPTVCTVAGAVVDSIAAGQCTVLASQPGNTTYAAATAVSNTFTVNAASAQTITFPAIPSQIVNTTLPLNAWASSGLPVTFSSTTQTICKVSGTTLTEVATGSCTVVASQSGNSSYPAAPSVPQTFNVTGAQAQTIDFPAIPPVYAAANNSFTPAAYATSGLTVTFASTTPTICTVSGGTTVNAIAAGTCSITASQAGNAFYQAAPNVTNTVTVSAPRPQSISFPLIPTQAPNATVTLNAEATSALPITYTASGACTVSGNTATTTGTGTCSITASQPGGIVYAAATPVTQSFAITTGASFTLSLASQYVTLGQGTGVTDLLSVVPVNGFSSPVTFSISGLPANVTASFSPSSPTTTSAQLTLNVLSNTIPGPYVITLNGVSGSLAATTTLTLYVTGTQTITFPTIGAQPIGSSLYLNASATSGIPVAFASTTPSVCSVSGNSATMLATGKCSITASQGGNQYFFPATPVSQSFTVTLAPQTIIFPAIPTQALGGGIITLSATATSGLAVSYLSTTPSVCAVSGSSVSLLAVGNCTIQATQAGNATYAAATPVSQSFTVTLVTQTINFPPIPAQTLGGGIITLSATATSGLAVSYQSTTPSICAVSGSSVSLLATGTCTIQATQAGNATYAAATPVSQSFTIKSAQAFTLALASPIVTIPSGGTGATDVVSVVPTGGFSGSVTLAAALPVLSSSTFSDAFVNPGNVTSSTSLFIIVAQPGVVPGQYVIPISGTSGSVTASTNLTVNVTGTQTITFPAIGTQTLGSGGVSLNATASSGLAVTYASTTASVCTVSGSTATLIATGTCTIQASQAGNTYYSAAPAVSQSFTVKAATPSFTLSAATGTLSQVPGASTGVTDAITIVPANGFTGTVNFTASGVPAGVDYAFTANSSATGTTFVIYVPAGVAASNNNQIVITGTSGSVTAKTTVTLNIP